MLTDKKEIALCEKYRELNDDLKNNCNDCPLKINERFCAANSTKLGDVVRSDFEIKGLNV